MASRNINHLARRESKNHIRDLLEQARKAHTRLQEENETRRRRNDWDRDLSRILYSTSFRRLQGKMQLLGIDPEHFFRNRLTHSLEVSQIARNIAMRTGLYKPDELQVVQAASLAHDIGNPPFGHCGEAVLNRINKEYGGFEGNAQALRILMQLEKKNPKSMGLNLTLRSLLAVTKYFVKRGQGSKKKFIYDDNYDKLGSEINRIHIRARTIDAQIMDVADQIAYAAHDLEDALSMKLFSVDEFLFEFKCWLNKEDKPNFAYLRFCEMVKSARKFAEDSENFHSPEKYDFLLRKELTGILVHSLVCDIDVIELGEAERCITGSEHKRELGFLNLGELARGLKKVTFNCINRTYDVQLYERRAEQIIEDLFHILSDRKLNKDFLLLPPEYRPEDHKDDRLVHRSVVDYIAGMMDTFAIALHKKFVGEKPLFPTNISGQCK